MTLRKIEKVYVTSDFRKSYRKLPLRIQKLADTKDLWFRKNAHDPHLKTHKLHGSLHVYWSYSVNREYRVLFRFTNDRLVTYFDIGTHEIYKR